MSIEKYSEYIAKEQQVLRDNGLLNEEPSIMGAIRDPEFKKDFWSGTKAAGRGALNSLTFFQGSKIKAGIDTLAKKALGRQTSYSKEYKQELEKEREAIDKYPAAYVAGAVAPLVVAAPGIVSGLKAGKEALSAVKGFLPKTKLIAKGVGQVAKGAAKDIAKYGAADAAIASTNKAYNQLKAPMNPMVPGQQKRNRLTVENEEYKNQVIQEVLRSFRERSEKECFNERVVPIPLSPGGLKPRPSETTPRRELPSPKSMEYLRRKEGESELDHGKRTDPGFYREVPNLQNGIKKPRLKD